MRITIEIDGKRLRPYAVGAILLGALGLPIWAYASSLTIPFTFANGQTADANDVNSNFSAIAVAVNDNDARIGNLATLQTVTMSSLVAAINELKGQVNSLNSQVAALNSGTRPTYSSSSDFVVFNTPGVDTFTVPAGVTRIMVELWGGGSGGNSLQGEATGGSAGGYGRDFISVSPGQLIAVSVGAGGGADADGGATQISANGSVILEATGGAAPPGAGSDAPGAPGGSGARYNILGGAGLINNPAYSAAGGSSAIGTASQAPGGGGAAGNGASPTAGSPGRVVIWY